MLYYFTACKPEARKNIDVTITNKYDVSMYEDLIETSDIENLDRLGLLHGSNLWGSTPGKQNTPRWQKMNIGDKILVYFDKEFKYYGQIVYKMNNEKLAEKIWGREKKTNNTWEYIYFIDKIQKINLDLPKFNSFFSYDSNFNPQGFNNINKTLMNYLETEYESIDSVIQLLLGKEFNKINTEFNAIIETFGEKNIEDTVSDMSEQEFEQYINTLSSDASIKVKEGLKKVRKYNKKLIDKLKDRAKHSCQICGQTTLLEFGVSIVEAHHIEKFSLTQNNKPDNIMILCPNHHRLVHKCDAKIDIKKKEVIYGNGLVEKIII